MKYPLIAACGMAVLATTFFASQAPAQRASDAPLDRRCISLREIDRTSIVDDHTILFYMKNRTVYENRLARTCPGLDRRTTLSYRVVLDQLCDSDTINVLDNYGFGFVQTSTCGIGVFTPIDSEDAETLLSKGAAD